MPWKDPEKRRAYNRDYYKRNDIKTRRRNAWLVRMYGITQEHYEGLLEVQQGVCAICGKPDPREFPLAVDHDHDTGQVRGLLCLNCNVNLGWLEHNRLEVDTYFNAVSDRIAA